MIGRLKTSVLVIILVAAELISISVGAIRMYCNTKHIEFDAKTVTTILTSVVKVNGKEIVVDTQKISTIAMIPDITESHSENDEALPGIPISVQENNSKIVEETPLVDDTALCQLAGDYYYKHNGTRPPIVRIDSYDGDIVVIHLYEALYDHDATWDWYYVDRYTGETTNLMGESFNIFND